MNCFKKMRELGLLIAILIFSSLPTIAQQGEASSIYTSLSGKTCHSVKKDAETGSSVQQCSGVGNYSLLVLDDDNRMSLTLRTATRKEYPLDLWTIVSKSFSTLGDKAEWRVRKTAGKPEPFALIVRVNASLQEDPDKPQKRSYLAVIKITAEKACVTHVVNAAADANLKARQLADDSANKDCLKP